MDTAQEIVVDLLRSGWVVEAARATLYRGWAGHEPSFADSTKRTERRAEIIAESLDARGGRRDDGLVEAHAAWMRSLAGERPGEMALGDLFAIRLGDWVELHAGPFLETGLDELASLGRQERTSVSFPEQLPDPPPFEPVEPVDVAPPGEVVLRFGILADIHIGSAHGERMARAAIADLNASGAELVVQLGDITDHGNRDEFERAAEVLTGLAVPYATMMGNHDVYSQAEERLSGREFYPRSFGREADGLLLEHKGFRFAVLDSAEIGASPFAPFDIVSGTFAEGSGGAVVRGALTPPQHEILADIAAPGSGPAFVFLHHPPQPFTAFPPVLFGLRDVDTGRLHATCDSGNVWGVFAGHTHRNARTRTFGPVPATEVAIPRDYPFGYGLVDVTEVGYAYRFVQISDEELLRDAYPRAGRMIRRYARGPEEARGFVWTKPA